MKALVTGANGMLGYDLTKELKKAGFKICSTDISNDNQQILFLDITDLDAAKSILRQFRPDIIFHLAAETDVDKCELQPQHAYRVNVIGTENMARLSLESDAVFLYISTMGVFDGRKDGPYNELDTPNPINVYSRTKLEGEKKVLVMLKKYYIVRVGWMMGGGRRDKKFVAKVLDLIEQKKQIRAVNDKYGSPTFTKDLSKGLIELIKTGKYGLYHMTNSGYCSRYDIALSIVNFLKKDTVVKGVSSEEFPLSAVRPRSEASESVKLESAGVELLRPWQEAIKEYIIGLQ